MKRYMIKTVQDVIDCTNEDNIDNFMIDFKKVVKSTHLVRSLVEAVDGNGEEVNISEEGFVWIDDGKNGVIKAVIKSEKGGQAAVEYGSEKFRIDLKPGGEYVYLNN